MNLVGLFFCFAGVGLLSVGGGYAAMPLIEQRVVRANGYLTMAEFADVMAIAEMTPGPIAVNAATFTGMRLAGLSGALAATAGCVLPTAAIVLLLAAAYERLGGLPVMQGVLSGVRPAVIAMIASAGLSLLRTALASESAASGIDPIAAGVFLVCLALLRTRRASPIAVMAGAGVLGAALHALL